LTYSAAITACEKGAQWHLALMLFNKTLREKITPDVIIYNATISACEKGGQWEQALNLFQAMPKATVPPDVISYSVAISACEKGGQWEQALNLFKAMPDADVVPNIVTYNALLECKGVYSSKGLGGRIFRQGLLPLLQKSLLFEDLKLDLHNYSEGAARLILQWWLSRTVARRLEVSDRLDCIVVTGFGKSRQAWDTTDVREAALDVLQGLELDAQILRESLADQVCVFPGRHQIHFNQ
jgi:pentatricopeptide repeat protein